MMARTALKTVSALALLTAATVWWMAPGAAGQASPMPSTKSGDWTHYTADVRGSRYAPLDQITPANFSKLEVAWRFKTDNLGTRPEYKLEGTPLAIRGTVYATGGTRRSVVALDGGTGEIRWVYSLREGNRAVVAPRQLSGRGLSYWTDGREERILYVTTGYRLVSLDAKTGQPTPGFGKNGILDLKEGVVYGNRQPIDLETGEIGLHSTPTVTKDTVIVGSSFREGLTVKTHNNTKGLVRGFDVRTGKLLWTFNTIPRPGEFGNDTWENDSWAVNGNTGVWTQITVDEDAGIAYLPVEDPTSDLYGGHRPGNNLFSDSLVAVDVKTGQRKWHFQVAHHPVWPIPERPVPQSIVPGEKTSPTQPIPTKPPAYSRTGVTEDDLIDFTPDLKRQGLELAKHYQLGPMFLPPVVSKASGALAALTHGTLSGGVNWPGSSYDPELHTAFVHACNACLSPLGLVKPPKEFSDLDYVMGTDGVRFQPILGGGEGLAADAPQGRGAAPGGATPPPPAPAQGRGAATAATPPPPPAAIIGTTVQGLSLLKPPYGTVSAINLDKGEITWQVAHGDTPDNVRNHPALRGLNIAKTGQAGNVGLAITKTLVVVGDPGVTTTPDHPRGAMLRAYDKATGKEVGAVWMPAAQSGSPMTYMASNRQYIIVAVSGGNYSGEYIAYALPQNMQ
jgi:quinoprotein glucose dehydrogenase